MQRVERRVARGGRALRFRFDEWPAVRAAFVACLDPANFDADGTQKRLLGNLMPAGAPTGS